MVWNICVFVAIWIIIVGIDVIEIVVVLVGGFAFANVGGSEAKS